MHVESYLKVDFSSSAQVKIQFRPFLKEIQIFGFPHCSTREDLSIDVSINNVASTDIDETKVISFSRGTDKIQFRPF